jgi:hypothetical protein
MSSVAVELSNEELERLSSANIEFTSISSSNFDGQLLNTILISLTSAASIKAMMPLFLEIAKRRKSGTIKINGLEIKNVSEATILKALEKSTTREK